MSDLRERSRRGITPDLLPDGESEEVQEGELLLVSIFRVCRLIPESLSNVFHLRNHFVRSHWSDAVVPGEVPWVVGKEPSNAVHLHGGGDSSVVDLKSFHLVLND